MISSKEQHPMVEVVLADAGIGGDLQGMFQAEREATILAKYPKLPADWRVRLPTAETHYRGHVSALGMPNAREWTVGLCPFHDDQQELAVSFSEGADTWCCLAGCGLGDRIDFHQRLTGRGFEAAVLDPLGIWE